MEEYFNKNEFTSLFFALLYKEGITKVNKNEILKKLCYYYNLPEFKCLFYDIGLSFGFDKIDISKSLEIEEEIKNIVENDNDLMLKYLNYDYKHFLTTKNNECLIAMNCLVKEFVLRLKIERLSRHPMNIYNDCADGYYNIFRAKYQSQNVYWQLITNGTTNICNKIDFQVNFAENPLEENSKIPLTDILSYKIEVNNASYTILKGMSDDKIGRIKAFTKITDEEKLRKINEYANDKEILLHANKEGIRRLHL